ncbi:MAG: hypothetical protein ACXWMN_02240 [Candidatus Limnocylindria bacterium]
MPVTDEQRAMLQLLLEGGQGYDDIGSLLGIAPDEVRSRARTALTEIGGADPDSQVGLSDYLLGQADPIGRADAVRHLQSDPDANALAQRLVQNLRLLAPRATLPEVPEPRGGRRAAAPPPPPSPAASTPAAATPPAPSPADAPPKGPGVASRAAGFFSGLGSLTGRRRTQAIVGGAIALVLVVVIIVVGTGGGGGGGSSDCKPLDVSAAQQAGVPTTKLSAVGDFASQDCVPTGQVTLVPVSPQNNQQSSSKKPAIAGFALQTNAAHLDATSNGDEYVLWLYKSDQQARPIGKETVGDSGNLTGAAPLPTQDLVFLQALQKIRLSRVTSAQANQIQQALQAQSGNKKATGVVGFVGTPVLEGSGTALLQQLQQQLQQAQSQSGTTSTGSKG